MENEFKVGDKVKFALDTQINEITSIIFDDESGKIFYTLNGDDLYSYSEDGLQPYKTAHEKLTEEHLILFNSEHTIIYRNFLTGKRLEYKKKDRVWFIDGNIDLKLSRIITQYLEEMKDEV